MVKITRIWQTKNFLRPVAAVMAARAFLFSSRETPFIQKIKPKIRFRILGKPSRRPKDKAAGYFATQPYMNQYGEEQNRRERSISGWIGGLNPDMFFYIGIWAKLSFSCLLLSASCLLFLSPAPASAATYQDVQNFLNNPAPEGCVNWVEEVGSGYKVWRRCAADNVLAHTNTYIYSVGSGTAAAGGLWMVCNGTFLYLWGEGGASKYQHMVFMGHPKYKNALIVVVGLWM